MDVGACVNAECEILLTGAVDIPLAAQFGMSEFWFAYGPPNQVSFRTTADGRRPFNGVVKGTGHISLAAGVTVTIERVDSTGAVIRLESKTDDPSSNNASGSEGLMVN